MKTIEDVQIPLLVVPPPETHRLLRWHVHDGEHVIMGQTIFDLEFGDTVCEVESFYSGFIKILAVADSEHKVGDTIATMVCDAERSGYGMIGIELSNTQLSTIDGLRGGTPRREFLWRLVSETLEEKTKANKAEMATPRKPSG